MVRWKCFRGRAVGATLDNGPCLAHHYAERAEPVLLALFGSEKSFFGILQPLLPRN